MGKIQVIPNLIFFRGGLIFPHLRNHNESASSGSNLLEDQGKGKRRKKIHTIFGIKNYILLENSYLYLYSFLWYKPTQEIFTVIWLLSIHLGHKHKRHGKKAAKDVGQRDKGKGGVGLVGNDERDGGRDHAQHRHVVDRHPHQPAVVDLLHLQTILRIILLM